MRAKPVYRLAHGFFERRLWQAKLTHRFLRRKVHGASRHTHASQRHEGGFPVTCANPSQTYPSVRARP